ncbi:MAG TPA: TIR domain-containing protein [Bryobacteraceae bacterium]|nr:TIR domain-containing protein [Bryobacteraceae bacterium]
MKERFEGDNRPNLIDALKRQEFVGGETTLAEAMADEGELVEFAKGHKIIIQGGEDNDIYLLVAGDVSIVIKGNEYTTRKAGQHVGEMAAIEPSQKRSADVVAHDTVVALKLSNPQFMKLGRSFPQIWLPMARELSRRVFQRNELISAPNEYPKLFIISSGEALSVANAIRTSLEHDVFSTVWNEGVFFAGGYSLEALEKAVSESDFAIAIAQADDIIEMRGSRQPTLRDNVLFELGLFMGKLGRHRALLIHPKVDGLKLPSDLHGLTLLRYEAGDPADLPARLKAACDEIRTIVKNLGVRTLLAQAGRLRAGS